MLGYPDGIHVNFVRVSEDGSLGVLTYEAGVEDVTPACGTGSTAAAYVSARIGRTSFPVRVRLLGGELVIDARGDSMTMRGPAEYMTPFALEWSASARIFPKQHLMALRITKMSKAWPRALRTHIAGCPCRSQVDARRPTVPALTSP
jgi:hypothetical protein